MREKDQNILEEKLGGESSDDDEGQGVLASIAGLVAGGIVLVFGTLLAISVLVGAIALYLTLVLGVGGALGYGIVWGANQLAGTVVVDPWIGAIVGAFANLFLAATSGE